jgi:uncharacterized protein YbjQ (UPF0145 family)
MMETVARAAAQHDRPFDCHPGLRDGDDPIENHGTDAMIITTGNDVEGYRIVQYLGLVRGIVVRSTGIARGIIGGLRSIGGGNIPEYVAVCEEARQQAYDLMVQHARDAGAQAIIAVRYDATEFIQGSTEVLAYGTAVKIEKA